MAGNVSICTTRLCAVLVRYAMTAESRAGQIHMAGLSLTRDGTLDETSTTLTPFGMPVLGKDSHGVWSWEAGEQERWGGGAPEDR